MSKPPIEYRPAPQKAGSGVSKPPEPKSGGVWVWVPDDKKAVLRPLQKHRDYMREYMRKQRAKAKT